MRAIRLKTEDLFSPLGLGTKTPHFSWNCEGGRVQTAYQIICIRAEAAPREVLWDSGVIRSSSMSHIAYEGTPLHSRDLVIWKVTLWDENGLPGEPAESRFELGLLEPADWTARWIAGDYTPKKKRRYPADCFRKVFAPDPDGKGIARARLYVTARGIYDVTINGHLLEDFLLAPGVTDYRKRIQYQTLDVTDLVQGGRCVLELCLADGWFRGSIAAYGVTCVYGTQTSLLAQLEMTYTDGTSQTICTDAGWDWSDDGPIRFADLKDGEIVDAGRVPSYRQKAREVPAPKALLVSSDNVPVTGHERFAAVPITQGVRDASAVILDFGQNIAGFLSFSVKGKKGQQLLVTCGEKLGADGHVDLSGIQETKPAGGWTQGKLFEKLLFNEVRGKADVTPRQQILFTCSGGEDHYRMRFSVFGFRYAEITFLAGAAEAVPIRPAAFCATAVYSDMEETGTFACSDERVNRLVENTRWSMKGNFLDIPTDCPTRERLGWTGDAQIFFSTGAYFFDLAAFMRKWLRDMRDAQYANGLLPAVLPYAGVEMMYKSTGQSVGWADAVYLIPWRYYLRYGDREVLNAAWPMMQRYAAFLEKHLEKGGHYEKGVHLGEWLEPEEFREKKYGSSMKHPEECTAYLYLAMVTMAKIADLLGHPEEARNDRAVAARAKEVYPRYASLDTHRQAKLVRPLALGLLDGAARTAAQKRLKQAVEHAGYRVGTGFLSTPFLLPVLTDAGYTDTAYRVLLNPEKPGWLYEVGQGATTIWEDWEGKLSQNHYSPSAVCQWLFDTCAGIRVAGENLFRIAPVPGQGLSFAEASYQSPYGRVCSRWERTPEGLRIAVSIPTNCTADIRLPDGQNHSVQAGDYSYLLQEG
ncbi:MAG: glycoside hydrolase family 78 protein [Lachnospiraceae bacterium]|nr:glycoside hydrolase family 78 protein [Lachnospiraceae bacterium]MCI1398826.1 glycoside hydrolase family 78 protein [Lachnospiraceae bacterium]MCI1424852.1 glycoside hydrolase family 78 protein [Lachnospiraceae bacterium]MCI1453544.1 glycoside hydrolase family 78 protein [Lachnospiraceae bacterium]